VFIVVNPKFMKSQDGFPKNLNVKVNTKENIKCIVVLATGSL
jgi:hypothetical protein